MGINKIHKGTVKKGKFIPRDRTALLLDFAKREGRQIEVVVRPEKKQRSGQQNKYYHGVVVALIAEKMGEYPEATHESLKVHFLTDNSGVLPKVKSTTDLTTVEFEEYLSKVRQFGAEFLDIYIPDPNEADY